MNVLPARCSPYERMMTSYGARCIRRSLFSGAAAVQPLAPRESPGASEVFRLVYALSSLMFAPDRLFKGCCRVIRWLSLSPEKGGENT
jgi:hypothetical protein